jgi:tRNA threonylcarbamoyladenosine biosynthesis protein TsaE
VRLDEIALGQWGERIGKTLEPPVMILLKGPLGAGKSVLARAIGRGAGVGADMPSPSYNLLLRYPTGGGLDVVHIDLFRIEGPEELWELGWSQLGAEHEIVLVEWPERAEDMLPDDRWVIELSTPPAEPLLRDVEVHRVGHPPELAGFPMSVSVVDG